VLALKDARGEPDVILVTVKGHQTESAAGDIAQAAGPRTRVVSFQNGLGHEETLAARLGGERIYAGATTISATLASPGRVVQHNRGGVAVAGWSGADPEPIVGAFAAAGVRARAYPRPLDVKWSKLLLNLLGNATSAIVDRPPEEVYDDAGLFAIDRLAFHEALAVMRALGVEAVDLPGYPVRLLARVMRLPASLTRPLLRRRMAVGRGGKLPSFLQDLRRRAPHLEVEYVNGAVARAARAVGLDAPVNARLATLLEEIASGRRLAAPFRSDPRSLAAAVRTSPSRP
jgi:2-dehydropantoate 2-reductase